LRHPGDSLLRSWIDGELGWFQAWRMRCHARGCPCCHAALAEQTRIRLTTERLLSELDLACDLEEQWERLHVLSERPRRPVTAHRRFAILGAASLAPLLLALVISLDVRRGRDAAEKDSESGEMPPRVQDLCCWDLDGGGALDDGVLAVLLPGERVVNLTLYEDRNGSGTLTALDPLRFTGSSVTGTSSARADVMFKTRADPRFEKGAVAAPSRSNVDPSRSGTAASRFGITQTPDAGIVRDLCCENYDGGGPSDDGLLTVNGPDERVQQVVLYDDRDASRSFSEADLVRWSSHQVIQSGSAAEGL
jgi:hypothetical protein